MTAVIKPSSFSQAKQNLAKTKRSVREAMSKAIDDTTRQVRTRASREIRVSLAVKASDLKTRLRRSRAFSKKQPKLTGKVYISERPLKLSRFKTKQTEAGVAVTIRRGAAPKIFSDTFGPNHPRLKGGIYRRTSESRNPIAATPGVPLAQDAIATGAIDRTKAQIPELLKNNTRRRLALLKRRPNA